MTDGLSGEHGGTSAKFEDTRCEADRDAAPTQAYMKCLFEYQSVNQQGAALWERETAARQADIQAKGNLAIVFGLLGFIGWGYAARLHARNRDLAATEEADSPHQAAAGTMNRDRLREAKRVRRLQQGKLSDEDLEDAWVEEHLSNSR